MTASVPATPSEAGGALTAHLAAITRWQSAESRIYPLVMADPDLYEIAVGLVVEVREMLRRDHHTFESLAALDVSDILRHCERTNEAAAVGVDMVTAVDAARAMRWREISASAAPNPGQTADSPAPPA